MGSVTFSQTKFPTDTDWNYMKHPGDFDASSYKAV